ncbi:MAG: hypothetical protein LBD84_05220 [Campylobacteraceae bacterium]|jgi:hypothetical protein|nr:hypothetical protein [Campylobacteraceae bacterium]
MLKKIFITAVIVFLSAGYGDESNSDRQILSGKLPKNLDRTDGLAGIDENRNGIRDDIEKYIVENYHDEGQKKALFQFAKTMQGILLADISDKTAIKKIDMQDSRAMHCIFLQFNEKKGTENPSVAWKKIRSLTTNTKSRLKAYLNFNKALDGTVATLPRGDTCE